MGCYIALNDASTIKGVVVAIRKRPYWADILVDDDFNVKLEEPEVTTRVEENAAALTTAGLDQECFYLERIQTDDKTVEVELVEREG